MANNRLNKIQNFLNDVIKCDFNVPTALGHIDPNGLAFLCKNINACNNNAVNLQYGIFLDSSGEYKCYLIEFIKYTNVLNSIIFKGLKKNVTLSNYMVGYAIVTDNLDEFMDVASAFAYAYEDKKPNPIDRFAPKDVKDAALLVSNGNNINTMFIDMAIDESGKSLYKRPKEGFGFVIKNKTRKIPMFNCCCDITVCTDSNFKIDYKFIYTDHTDILTQFQWDEYNIRSFISAYKEISNDIVIAIDKIKDGTADCHSI